MPYIGLPFQDGGRGPLSFDCWGLVRDIYARELGILLPSYGEISAKDLVRVAREMDGPGQAGWIEVATPAPFDVVLMRAPTGRRAVVHVGVMIDADRLIHVEEATASVIVPCRHFSVAGRIQGFRRHA